MPSKRIHWIDCLKGIGAILVVFAHLSPDLRIEKFIYSFHMFLLFFISGLVYHRHQDESILSVIKKKFVSYMVPFFVWDGISSVYSFVSGVDLKEIIRQFFVLDGGMNWNAPIWFLMTLFFVEVIYLLIDSIPFKQKVPIAMLTCLIAAYLLKGHNYPLKVGIIPIGLFFYYLGILSASLDALGKIARYKHIMCFILFIATFFLSQLNDRISVINAYYGNFVFCILCGVSGVFSVTILCNIIFSKHESLLLARIGRDSLFIMCIQYPIFLALNFITKSIWGIGAWHDRGTLKASVVSIVSFAIIYCILPILRKLPSTLKRSLGVSTK